MKKVLFLAAFILTVAFSGNAMSQEPLDGTYSNDIGTVTIAKSTNPNANYDVTIADKSGKCNIQIVAATNKVTAQGANGATFHPNMIAAVESETFPSFSLWPEDQSIRLANDALPFEKLDPACAAFKGNMMFNRVK